MRDDTQLFVFSSAFFKSTARRKPAYRPRASELYRGTRSHSEDRQVVIYLSTADRFIYVLTCRREMFRRISRTALVRKCKEAFTSIFMSEPSQYSRTEQ